jgi:hypothetical protein
MGFLDHATNNIILDAVLTDVGREFLARNDGSFSIYKFAAADDEVDYTIIPQFGRTVGKEKITKNTPVSEALTNANLDLKYKLVSISNPNLVRIPAISLSSPSSTTIAMTKGQGSSAIKTVTIEQDVTNENTIDVELVDNLFIVTAQTDFVRISQGTSNKTTSITPTHTDSDRVATYLIPRDATLTQKNGATLTINLLTRPISDQQFTTFGNYSNKSQITTYIAIQGISSGQRLTLQVNISK